MDNFPGKIPHKLSPFIDDSVNDRAEFPQIGAVSRRLVSLFAPESEQTDALMRSDFLLPQYYLRSAIIGESELKLKAQHVKKFSIDTLMYCFYFLPKDVLQAVCAQELALRNWKYHTELKRWFRDDNKQSFDVSTWSQKAWSGPLDTSRFILDYSLNPSKAPHMGALRTSPL